MTLVVTIVLKIVFCTKCTVFHKLGTRACGRLLFLLARKGGGGVTDFVLSLCNRISTSTFDLRFAFLVPPQSENASYAPDP